MSNTRRFLCILAALAAATSIGSAQHTEAYDGGPDHLMPWPGTGPLQLAVTGDFQGRSRQNVVVASGGTLGFAFDPMLYDWSVNLPGPSSVTGLATLRPSVTVTRDTLLITSASNTQVGAYDSGTSTFAFTTQVNLTSSWNGSHGLVSGQDSPGGVVRFAGISQSGTKVLIGKRNGLSALVVTGQAELGVPVYAVQLMDWDRDGVLDVHATAQDGIHVLRANGQTITTCGISLTGAATARAVVSGLDEVVFVNPDLMPSAYATAFTMASTGSACAMTQTLQLLAFYPNGDPMTMGDQVPTGLAAYDCDGDGISDFLLTRAGTYRPLLVNRISGTQTEIPISAAQSSFPSLNVCAPILRNLNGNGIPDALLFWTSPRGVVVLPHCAGGTRDSTTDQIDSAYWHVVQGQTTYKLTLRMKTPTAVPANKTFRFEVVQWREQAISPAGSGWQPLEPQAVVFGQNVTGGAPGVPANTLEDIDMTFLTTLNESHLFALPDCYYLEIRWLDDSNKVLYSEVDGLSIPDQLEHLGSLQTSPGRVSGNIPICSGSPPPIGSEPSAIQVGGIHSNVRPPDVPTVPTDG